PHTRKGGAIMNTGKRRLLVGGALTALTLAALLGSGAEIPAARAAEGDEVEYTFGRPVQDGEQTYSWYRKIHADEAAKRDGVDAETPDQYGLMVDRMKDGALTWDPEVFGYSSGVLGIQLFPNKRFDSKAWSLKKYMDDPAAVEPPYLAGLSCVYCHVSFNPNRPPSNPGEPKWENLDSNIGNQY